MVVWIGVQSGVFFFLQICNITYSDCLPVFDYPQCWRMVKSSQVPCIYIALLTIQILTKQLHNIKTGKYCVNNVK